MIEEKVYSVSEINRNLKNLINERQEFKNIWVQGEISNFSISGVGHSYFSLKDNNCVIRCTFFSSHFRNYKGKKLSDGMQVQVLGSLSVYEAGGTYNINVSRVDELGKGDILYRIEQLKAKLDSMGIFDPDHKKPIPRYPRTLGIATASGGAALEDIIRITKDRYPNINILIAPCLVQGEMAPASIINAIKELNNPVWGVDVIIAGRGGGSFEDLMAFNDENVVMAFYNSNVPIISAVGHQIDSVLTDFAADATAPTPTAAAEFAVPDLDEMVDYLEGLSERITQSLRYVLTTLKDRFTYTSNRHIFQEPMDLLEQRIQRVDEILSKIFLLGKNHISSKKNLLQKFDTLERITRSHILSRRNRFELIQERVENFSPLGTLRRGYSVVRDNEKNVLRSGDEIEIGEEIEIILEKGRLKAEVKEKL
ncbi:MAG: exodeoxyribonuclease VII large subunit [Leptospiraceae bacterium]|nr:exodeoxyribonuclease VII large subunit [Leptospiraceae bacterium]MCP5512740.1 exodeoxyribonuclease VII large subunit [Leptospiraceae bacterium]